VDPSFVSGGRATGRKAFLDQMDSVVPWVDLMAIVEARGRRQAGGGRQPWPTEVLLRMFLVQAWLNLSDEVMEDALCDSLAVRESVGSENDVPDATTLLRFRHMAGKDEPCQYNGQRNLRFFMRSASPPDHTQGLSRGARRTPASPLPARDLLWTYAGGSGCSTTRLNSCALCLVVDVSKRRLW
jgi:hypothetical protein